MSVQINTGKTTFTPEEQLELKRRLDKAESRAEKQAIFEAYKKEVGLVDQSSVEQTKAPVKPAAGTAVEKNSADKAQDKDKIVSQKSTTTIAFSDIIKGMTDAGFKLDEKSTAELGEALKKAGIGVDKEGNISIGSQEAGQKLNTVIANYAKGKQEAQIKFDQNTDQEFISRMVEDGAIKANQDGTYTVLDKAKAEGYLNKVEQPPQTVQEEPVELNLDATKETKTVKKESAVDVPEDLRHNKDARKQLTKDYEAYLTEWVKDPENAARMDCSIALTKYDKKISKQMDKISKECKNNEDVLDKYMNEYASPMEKTLMNKMLEDAKKDDKALLDAYNRSVPEKYRITSFDGGASDARKDIAAKLYLCEDKNFNPKVLIESMAVKDVMGSRTEKEIEKDRKYFIEEEAKRQVKADETAQNVKNTRVYFSDEEREAAEAKSGQDSYVQHNDIGKVGRKLVNECPDEFCDRVDNPEEATKGIEPMTVTDPKTGKTKTVYFKFNENKFKEFCKIACDSRHKDDKSQENFGIDGNLTLKEGRESAGALVLIGRDGKRHSFEEIIGNDNSNVGNRELNKFRRLVMKSGQSVDKNQTWLKRFGHVALTAFGTSLASMATAGLASPLVGAVVGTGIAKGQEWATADRYIDYNKTITTPGQTITTPDQTVHVDGHYEYIDGKFVEVPGFTINDSVTINGITKDIEHIIPDSKIWVEGFDHWVDAKDIVVKGQDIYIEGKKIDIHDKIFVKGESGKTEDQTVQTKTNNTWRQVKKQALVGAITGLVTGLATMSGKQAKGQSFDGIQKLDKIVQETDTEAVSTKLIIPQSRVVSVRSGQITDTTEVETRPAVRYRGPEAYTVLYQIDGADIPAKYKKAVYMKLDEMWREGTNNKFGDIPRNVPVYPAFTINVDGQEITVTRKDNWASVNINEGKPGTTGGIYDAKTKEEISYRGRGRITE